MRGKVLLPQPEILLFTYNKILVLAGLFVSNRLHLHKVMNHNFRVKSKSVSHTAVSSLKKRYPPLLPLFLICYLFT